MTVYKVVHDECTRNSHERVLGYYTNIDRAIQASNRASERERVDYRIEEVEIDEEGPT